MASNVIDLFGAVTSRARSVAASLDTPARKLYAQAPDGYRDQGVARGNEPASAPKTSGPTSTDPLSRGSGGFSIEEIGRAVAAGIGAIGGRASKENVEGIVKGAEEKEGRALSDFFGIDLSRILWGGAGFGLFLVGAIMSRPREVQALAAATDTAGSILTAPVKGAKGALDTAALFKVSAPRKAIGSDKKPPSLDAPKKPPGPDSPPEGGNTDRMREALRREPRPGVFEFGGKGETLEFGEVNSTKAAARKETASNAGKASGVARKAKAERKAFVQTVFKAFQEDVAKPGPLEPFGRKPKKTADPLANIPLGDTGGELAKDARRKGVPENRIMKPGDPPPNQRKDT
jgi:hypothetical protein